jgi:hypothetical protein
MGKGSYPQLEYFCAFFSSLPMFILAQFGGKRIGLQMDSLVRQALLQTASKRASHHHETFCSLSGDWQNRMGHPYPCVNVCGKCRNSLRII